jgi:hypothetical protein
MFGLTDGATLLIAGHGGEYPIISQTERYVIAEVPVRITKGGRVIMCKTCKRVSANPDDVAEKYCGFCHEFLEAR